MDKNLLLLGILAALLRAGTTQLLHPRNLGTEGTGDKVQHPGTDDQCAAFCDQTFTPHTSEQSDAAKSCKQGCRLFSMLQFATDENATSVRDACTTACKEAYANAELLEACNGGCAHQSPYTDGNIEIDMDSSSPLFKYAQSVFESMFSKMDNMQKGMMSRFNSLFSPSEDNGNSDSALSDIDAEMNRMQQEVSRMIQNIMTNPDLQAKGPVMIEDPREQKNNGKPKTNSDLQFQGRSVGNQDENGDPILIVQLIPVGEHEDQTGTLDSLDASANEPSPPLDPSQTVDPSEALDPDASWLACLASRVRRLASITRWLVCFAMFMCVMCMIWICLAIIRTAPRRRPMTLYSKPAEVKIAGLSSPTGEKQFLVETHAQPDCPPPPYDAEPLPVKITQA